MMRRLIAVFALLFATAASARTVLDAIPTPSLVQVQPGSTVQLLGRIQNLSTDVIYLRGISYAAVGTFTGTVSMSDFVHSKPDSLRPGDAWEGAIARIVVPAGPGKKSSA